jgi:hypothetical protein
MKLSDKVVASLSLPEGKSEAFFWDEKLTGFAPRIRSESYLLTRALWASGTSKPKS